MNDHCVEWSGAKTRGGYGQLKISGTRHNVRAHRWAWERFFGSIPNRLMVLHRCDNPPSTRRTLFLGTAKDNMADASRKGRLRRLPHPTVCSKCDEPRLPRDTYCRIHRREQWHLRKARGWKRKR